MHSAHNQVFQRDALTVGGGFAMPRRGFAVGGRGKKRGGDGCSGVTAEETVDGSWRRCHSALGATTSSSSMQMEKEGCRCFHILQNGVVLVL